MDDQTKKGDVRAEKTLCAWCYPPLKYPLYQERSHGICFEHQQKLIQSLKNRSDRDKVESC